jgi:UDP-N-acetylglucosamine diphosphorylase/glucosamine-1-phosphate N-acetyltransferase
MMSTILFDDPEIRVNLKPFTLTRPIATIRIGIFTIAEKWQRILNSPVFYQTEDYLSEKFPCTKQDDALYINGALCPTPALFTKIQELKEGEILMHQSTILAYKSNMNGNTINYTEPITILRHCWDIFQQNGDQIRQDFNLYFSNKKVLRIDDPYTVVYNPTQIFIEEGANIKAAILNAENGPIYIGKDTEIQEGSLIRGPFALCEGSVVNMGAKMRGDNTIGPYSKVGGEISNSVIFGYSNKGHDGFLGNSVIGEWCNLGADTNTSNLKNTYSEVALYSYKTGQIEKTGQQFCGMMMGDHSKTSINCMLNTGTVIGVCTNIFGHAFPPKFIPSFAWGGSEGFEIFNPDKAFEIATKTMIRRNIVLNEIEKNILRHVFKHRELSL